MARCGFAAKGLFVMDGSKRRRTPTPISPASARPSASSSSTRCWRALRRGEVEAVLAHELGHFKLRHIVKRIVALFAISLAVLRAARLAVDAAPGSTRGLGVAPEPAGRRTTRWRCCCSAVRAGVRVLRVAAVRAAARARHEFEADAFAATQPSGQRPGAARCSSCTRTTPRR